MIFKYNFGAEKVLGLSRNGPQVAMIRSHMLNMGSPVLVR